MKKLFLNLCLMLVAIAAQALPFVPTTNPSSSTTKWYYLKTGNNYIYSVSGYYSEIDVSSTSSATDDYLWCFVGTQSSGYKIYNKKKHAYLREGMLFGDGSSSSTNYVEAGNGDSFYIYFRLSNQKFYLIYDSNDGFSGENGKYNSYTVEEYVPPVIDGDVNGDGLVSSVDVTVLYNWLLNNDDSNMKHGDQNGDGIVSSVDVTIVYNILLGPAPDTTPIVMTTYTVNGVSFKMVEVNGGTFTMGAPDNDTEAMYNERPAHKVTLSTYSIGQTEVTQELWIAVMGENPSWFSERMGYSTNLKRPVEAVSLSMCQEFIAKLNQMTGKNFRLPTEAEWQFAARGGNKSKGYKYAGSNNIDEVAWYSNNASAVGSGSPDYGTHSVATKAPNELSLYDMSGNVRERVSDWYGIYTSDEQTNPTGPATGTKHVVCGGTWNAGASTNRVTTRADAPDDSRHNGTGLRLAL